MICYDSYDTIDMLMVAARGKFIAYQCLHCEIIYDKNIKMGI